MRARRGWVLGGVASVVTAGIVVGLTLAFRGGSDSDGMAPPRRTARPAPTATADVASSAEAADTGPAWSIAKVMRLIDRTRIGVDGQVLRVDSETTLCSGRGVPVVRGGTRRWRAFDCTFTTFSGGIDRDLEFRVDVTGTRSYVVREIRSIGNPP
jgi:hypothetical protein